jgi:hypothetical protein
MMTIGAATIRPDALIEEAARLMLVMTGRERRRLCPFAGGGMIGPDGTSFGEDAIGL